MNDSRTNEERARRVAEAVAWRLRLNEADADTTPDFEQWVGDPANAEAWAQTVAMWEFVGEQARAPEMVMARQAALTAATRAIGARRRPARWRKGAAAAAVLAIGVAGWMSLAWWHAPRSYATGFGERRVITLDDGSRVSLDSDSDATVRYTPHARTLKLLRGQARFDVAHDIARPFSVTARGEKVIATGTAFNVDMTEPQVLVTLIQGHVLVVDENEKTASLRGAAPPQPHRVTELRAGQQLAALPARAPVVTRADVAHVTAWTNGQLIFSDEPLSDVVARVSHYSATPIVVADPGVARERISGVFNTGDVPGFLDIITQDLPVEAVADDTGRIVLRKK